MLCVKKSKKAHAHSGLFWILRGALRIQKHFWIRKVPRCGKGYLANSQVCLSLCALKVCVLPGLRFLKSTKLAQEPTQLQQINLIKFGGSQKAKEAHRGAAEVA